MLLGEPRIRVSLAWVVLTCKPDPRRQRLIWDGLSNNDALPLASERSYPRPSVGPRLL